MINIKANQEEAVQGGGTAEKLFAKIKYQEVATWGRAGVKQYAEHAFDPWTFIFAEQVAQIDLGSNAFLKPAAINKATDLIVTDLAENTLIAYQTWLQKRHPYIEHWGGHIFQDGPSEETDRWVVHLYDPQTPKRSL